MSRSTWILTRFCRFAGRIFYHRSHRFFWNYSGKETTSARWLADRVPCSSNLRNLWLEILTSFKAFAGGGRSPESMWFGSE
jgi:hypothetical protein